MSSIPKRFLPLSFPSLHLFSLHIFLRLDSLLKHKKENQFRSNKSGCGGKGIKLNDARSIQHGYTIKPKFGTAFFGNVEAVHHPRRQSFMPDGNGSLRSRPHILSI